MATEKSAEVAVPILADELRVLGLTVAVHNDYRLNGEAHTFWLFTDAAGMSYKGEGKTDAEALAAVLSSFRAALARSQPQGEPVAWLLLDQGCRGADDCEDYERVELPIDLSADELARFVKAGCATPLYAAQPIESIAWMEFWQLMRENGNFDREHDCAVMYERHAKAFYDALFAAPVAQPVTPLQAPDQAQEQAINAAAREVADCYEAGYDCTVVIEKYRLAKKGNSKVKVGTTAETIDAALNARYLILRSDEYAADVVIGAFGGDTADTKDWGKSLDEWCDAAIKTMAPAPTTTKI